MSSSEPLVFVSYSSQDRPWADRVIEALEGQGIPCWFAPRNIAVGAEWGSAIIDGIHQASAMVVVFSGNANESSHVRREVERAISMGVPILPIRVDRSEPMGALDYALGNTQWLDALHPPIEKRLQELVQAVTKLVADTTELAPPTNAVDAPAERSNGRRSRLPVSIGVVVGAGVLIAVLGFFVFRRGSSDMRVDPMAAEEVFARLLPTKDADGEPFVDRNADLFGRWNVVREYNGKSGFFPPGVTRDRSGRWVFYDDQLAMTRKPTRNTRAGSRGRVFVRGTDNEHHFDFLGVSSEGKPVCWVGLYRLEADRLKIIYRMQFPFMDGPPPRPKSFSVSEEADVGYVELIRP